MKRVSELHGRHPGSDVYVVGTGTSLRVFPTEFLRGRIVIGLNLAWKVAPVTYGITIHPDLNVPEFLEDEEPRPEISWIVSEKKAREELDAEQFQHAEKQFFFFEYQVRKDTQFDPREPSDSGRVLRWVEQPTADHLYNWSSISQAAVNLAANMGADNVILVGCDNCSLAENHHAHGQHTRWKGAAPDYRYAQYREGLSEVRSALRTRGVRVVSMTPFLGLDFADEEFAQLCDELRVPLLIEGTDISPPPPPPAPLKKRVKKYARRVVRSLRETLGG